MISAQEWKKYAFSWGLTLKKKTLSFCQKALKLPTCPLKLLESFEFFASDFMRAGYFSFHVAHLFSSSRQTKSWMLNVECAEESWFTVWHISNISNWGMDIFLLCLVSMVESTFAPRMNSRVFWFNYTRLKLLNFFSSFFWFTISLLLHSFPRSFRLFSSSLHLFLLPGFIPTLDSYTLRLFISLEF